MPNSIVNEFDAYLTPAERELVARARQFGQSEVATQARQWEHDRQHPTATLRGACDAGLAKIQLPVDRGGAGLRFSTTLRVVEELAKHDFGFAFSLVNHHNAMLRIAGAQAPLGERLLPLMLRGEAIGCAAYTEPDHGSDLGALKMGARRIEGGWLLDGSKAWITNAAVAGVFITLAQTDPGSGSRGLATFVIEADNPGFIREPPYSLHGSHSIGVGGFRLEQCFVPDTALLDLPGEAFRKSIRGINGARCYVAAMCGGMLDASIACAAEYTSHRMAFGKKVIEFQGPRWSLVDATTDLAALRLLAYRAARQIDAGENAEEAAALAKKFAGDRMLHHIAACVQALGANGLRAQYPLMRHLAACKAACFTDGTTEMMNERLSALMAKAHPRPE